MMRAILLLIIGMCFFQPAKSQELISPADSLFLNIVIPEQDTVIYAFTRYRVAANTHPMARAFINGDEAEVYASGAFVGMIEHRNDTTEIDFRVEMNGESISRKMLLVKPEPASEEELKGKVITRRLMQPASEQWLQTGETLEVQFLGSPGQKAVFNIDGFKRNIPMTELSPALTNGRVGVYRGSYEILPGDRVENAHITFKMKKNFFSYKKLKSDVTVSFNGLPRVGIVQSENAYFNIGMGTDRLGGAKHGFIQNGVKLNITGQREGNYRVQLSPSLDAWIPAHFVELQSEFTRKAESLTGNIRVIGESRSDLIILNLSEKLPYISYQEINPNKIIVDVFGATSNTNWNTQYQNATGIEEVEWQQVENGRFRLIIKLKHSQNWGYSVGYGWGNQLNVRIKRPPVIEDIVQPLKGRIIAVDAGHGGESAGALGAAGFTEKDVTLMIARKVQQELTRRGANVIMTRTIDEDLSMAARKRIIMENRAEMLISIHANSVGYSSNPVEVQGSGVFYKHIAFRPLAELMYKKMLELGFTEYGLTGSFNFSLNGPTEFPNVLIETAFISNPGEEILLSDIEFQQSMARQIADGLEEYYLKHARTRTIGDL